jgi:hypothetical protein
MNRIKKQVQSLQSYKTHEHIEYEPSTPSLIVSPSSGQQLPNEEIFEILEYYGQEWRPASYEPGVPSSSMLDLKLPKSFDKFDRRIEHSIDVHKMSKRRQAPVSTTLGLIHVRFAALSISHIPMSDIRTGSILSLLAYHTPDTVKMTQFESELLPEMEQSFPICITPGSPTDIQASLWFVKSSRTLFIAFRGNHDLDEIYNALGLSLGTASRLSIDDSHHVVNDWFAKDFKRIEIFLRPILEKWSPKAERIICTGSGLGGAIATIAGPYIGELFKRKCDVITFGSPKVGSKDFIEWYKLHVDKTCRLVYTNDPLPYLPLNRKDMEHVSDGICISKNGYIEKWPHSLVASPNIIVGISKIDFDDFRWEHYANKYRKMVIAAIGRERKGLSNSREHNKLIRGRVVSPTY